MTLPKMNEEGPPEDAFTEPIEEVRAYLRREGIDTTSLKKFVHEKLAQLRRLKKEEPDHEYETRVRDR